MTRMTLKNRRRFALGPLMAGGALVAALGCDYRGLSVVGEGPAAGQTDLGAICPLGTDPASTSIAIDTESTACSSHLCLKPNEEITTDTAALCTQSCEQDSDCRGGQTRDPSDPMDKRCQIGFTCRAIVPNLAQVSSVACQKLCVCQDFLRSPQATTPAGCS